MIDILDELQDVNKYVKVLLRSGDELYGVPDGSSGSRKNPCRGRRPRRPLPPDRKQERGRMFRAICG